MLLASPSLPERPRLGECIEGLELIHLIASGGMADVYLARRQRAGGFEKRLALKVMHPQLATDPDLVAMFVDEARIASNIAHPNVVEVFDTGMHRGLPWIAMELVDGPALQALLPQRPAPALLARVLGCAARGLHAAHEARDANGRPLSIVHRDVSPQNILVGRDGRTKVTDFGIAWARGRLTHTETGELKGKTGYLAPEQLTGSDDPQGMRQIDVWAFGVTAWESFRGVRLFDATEPARRLRQVEAMPIPPLDPGESGVGRDIAEVIAACLQRNPLQRPQSLEEVARVFESWAGAREFATDGAVAAWMSDRFAAPAPEPCADATVPAVAPSAQEAQVALSASVEASEPRSEPRAESVQPRLAPSRALRLRAGVGVGVGVSVAAMLSWWALRAPFQPVVQREPSIEQEVEREVESVVATTEAVAVTVPLGEPVPRETPSHETPSHDTLHDVVADEVSEREPVLRRPRRTHAEAPEPEVPEAPAAEAPTEGHAVEPVPRLLPSPYAP